MKVLPYSYSSLTGYETCPWQYYRTRVSKEVKRAEYVQATQGIDIHKQAEDYVVEGKVFEGKYAPRVIATVDALKKNGGIIHAEKQLAVTRDMKPTGWWDKDCHARGVLDVYQVNGDTANIVDWKTGKSDPFSLQLKHNALLVFIHEPKVQKVNYVYEWLKEGHATKGTVHRDFLASDWNRFEQRVIRLEKSLAENNWPKKPSGLCKKYCPDTECEHNGNYAKAE